MSEKKRIIRKVLKAMNGCIDKVSILERDVPITSIASLEMNNEFSSVDLQDLSRESLQVASKLNGYKRDYWKLEILIRQFFLDTMKKSDYLPGRSIEVESLANALPESIIKGDERIWIYSYDHYIDKIAQSVGRRKEGAPTGDDIWYSTERRFEKRIKKLVDEANKVLPDVFHLKSKLTVLLRNEDTRMDQIRIKRPRITPISRPIKKVMIIKRPIPLPGKGRMPRKRVLKKPSMEVIGPEDSR